MILSFLQKVMAIKLLASTYMYKVLSLEQEMNSDLTTA